MWIAGCNFQPGLGLEGFKAGNNIPMEQPVEAIDHVACRRDIFVKFRVWIVITDSHLGL